MPSQAPKPRDAVSDDAQRHKPGRRSMIAGILVLLAVAALVVGLVVIGRQRPTANGSPGSPVLQVSPGSPASSVSPTWSDAPGESAVPQRVLFEESFDGSQLDRSIWNTCHWWDDGGCTIDSNNEMEWYTPDQVTVSDGALHLTAAEIETSGSNGRSYPFRSGMVTTGPRFHGGRPKFAFTYGSVEARLLLPAGRGLWPAFWMLPANSESVPEIDILEVLGQSPNELLMHLHPQDRSDGPSKRYRLPGANFAEAWHTLRLHWAPGRLEYFVDGHQVWQLTSEQVPAEPMYLVFNLAVGGDYPGEPDESTRFPATFAIDYVRVTGDR
jgi:beta-glucanase (GH16 family)